MKLRLARPAALSAVRVRENCFLVSPSPAHWHNDTARSTCNFPFAKPQHKFLFKQRATVILAKKGLLCACRARLRSLVSVPTATPDRSKDQSPSRRARQAGKWVLAGLLVLLLMYLGERGKDDAGLQLKIDELTLRRDQLQQTVEDAQTLSDNIAGTPAVTGTPGGSPVAWNQQITNLANALRANLEQFDSQYRLADLSKDRSLDIRLCRATLANADRRFAEALSALTTIDEKQPVALAEVHTNDLVRVFQIRADSFYGLGQWQNAFACYGQALALQPGRISALARLASCQNALARYDDALTTYEKLCASCLDQGNDLFVQGKLTGAVARYQQVIQTATVLLAKGRGAVLPALAWSRYELANTFLLQERPEAAIGQYEQAIEIETRLLEQQGRKEFAGALAQSHGNLGAALLGRQRLEAALGHYDKAIEIQAPLAEQPAPRETDSDLALSYNNRGVVRRALGQADAAIGDFDHGIKLLTLLVQPLGFSQATKRLSPGSTVPLGRVKLDVVIEYAETNVEVSTRARFVGQAGGNELTDALVACLKNRGYAQLAHGKMAAAVVDFKQALSVARAEQQADLRATLERCQSANRQP